MVFEIVSALTELLVRVISHFGYPGLFLLMALESAAMPIPSEIVLPFSGFLVSEGRFTLSGVAITAGLASALGSAITYMLGKHGGHSFVNKYGKYVLLTPHDIEMTNRFFSKFGLAAAFLGRFVPVVRAVVSIPAGIARVPFIPFLMYSFAGSLLWGYLLGYLGLSLGPRWFELRDRFHWVDYVVLAMFAVLIIALVTRRIRQGRTLDQTGSKW
ncbi:MAG: DedA family protein [Candidatus Doudnabacteria bacterium]|nr:DedA family protein [Candidatus Doudnabacteria bacterium]